MVQVEGDYAENEERGGIEVKTKPYPHPFAVYEKRILIEGHICGSDPLALFFGR